VQIDFLRFTSTSANWPAWLDGRPHLESLGLAFGCYSLWCFGLLPRRWRTRRGYARAVALLWARVVREPFSRLVGLVWLAGVAGIALVWLWAGPSWRGLLTALVGVAGGAGIVWVVRVIAVTTLKKEAMGFGDVTFLAMVGAFVGWQAALVAFFAAPLAAVFIGIAQWLLGRGNELPYVPYLALATTVVVVAWADVWNWGAPFFGLGFLIPVVLVVCLGLMAGMLWLMGLVTRR
jgi:prepilin signal peptidase PulO-like enzyme (type II secretory pathway)